MLFANISEVAITNAYARNQQADPIILVSKRKLSGNQKLNGKPKCNWYRRIVDRIIDP